MLRKLFVAALFALSATAQDRLMAGLDGVSVNVTLKPAVTGLPDSIFRSDIELRLRQYGIPIKSGAPVLNLEVRTLAGPSKSVSYFSTLRLMQDITLERDPQIKGRVATWSQYVYGVVSEKQASKALREEVMVILDQFIATYLRARDAK